MITSRKIKVYKSEEAADILTAVNAPRTVVAVAAAMYQPLDGTQLTPYWTDQSWTAKDYCVETLRLCAVGAVMLDAAKALRDPSPTSPARKDAILAAMRVGF